MNYIDFTKKGGFPLTQDTLDWMQKSYSDVISGLAGLCGDNVIISGCKPLSSGGVEAGWLSVKNKSGISELVYMPLTNNPFTHVLIKDVSIEKTVFKEGQFDVYFKREAQAVNNPVGDGNTVIIEWSNFSRVFTDKSDFEHKDRYNGLIKTLNYLHEKAEDLKNEVASLARIPQGLISMWSGKIENIPVGWALCDGNNGTPNLKGRFVVGYDSSDSDFNKMQGSSGSKTVSLTKENNAPHVHSVDDYYMLEVDLEKYNRWGKMNVEKGWGGDAGENRNAMFYKNHDTYSSGNGKPFEILPPYFVLAYIMKL